MTHSCDAAIVTCIDFRFQKFIRNWTDKELKGKKFDAIALAGSTKELNTILKQIDISCRLHNIKEVYLIHHQECGAYGKESTPQKHFEELQKAKTKILSKYPNLKVLTYYLHLDGTFEEVN